LIAVFASLAFAKAAAAQFAKAVGATAAFGVVFGLSIDYAAFLLTRMRESYEGGASNEGAVLLGWRRRRE
jgi:uncharacterized membrane protein YdfJ with MMPL/SSD domain